MKIKTGVKLAIRLQKLIFPPLFLQLSSLSSLPQLYSPPLGRETPTPTANNLTMTPLDPRERGGTRAEAACAGGAACERLFLSLLAPAAQRRRRDDAALI